MSSSPEAQSHANPARDELDQHDKDEEQEEPEGSCRSSTPSELWSSLGLDIRSAASSGDVERLGPLLQRLHASTMQSTATVLQTLGIAVVLAIGNQHAACLRLILDSCTAPAAAVPLSTLLDVCYRVHCAPPQSDASGPPRTCAAVSCPTSLLLRGNPVAGAADPRYEHWTALMIASLSGHLPSLRLLLSHHPHTQVTATTLGGQTAAMLAAASGHTACLHLLLAHSPATQLSARDTDSFNPLAWAAVDGRVGPLTLLLSHAPPQHQLDSTLLHLCRVIPPPASPPSPTTPEPIPTHYDRRVRDLNHCAALLLAKGARLPAREHMTPEVSAVLCPLIQDLAARALAPGMANEAVLGLALAARRWAGSTSTAEGREEEVQCCSGGGTLGVEEAVQSIERASLTP